MTWTGAPRFVVGDKSVTLCRRRGNRPRWAAGGALGGGVAAGGPALHPRGGRGVGDARAGGGAGPGVAAAAAVLGVELSPAGG